MASDGVVPRFVARTNAIAELEANCKMGTGARTNSVVGCLLTRLPLLASTTSWLQLHLQPRKWPSLRLAVVATISAAFYYLVDFVQQQLIYFPSRPPASVRKHELALHDQTLANYGYKVSDIEYVVKPRGLLGCFRYTLKQRGLLIVPTREGHHITAVASDVRSSQARSGALEARSVDTLWVVCGGNAMLATHWIGFIAEMLRQASAIVPGNDWKRTGFLLLDYPGYDRNEGAPSAGLALLSAEAGVQAALATLRTGTASKLDSDGGPVALSYVGHSLGCAAVTQLAASLAARRPTWLGNTHPVHRLVLSAPFTSIPKMGQVLFGDSLAVKVVIWFIASISRHTWSNEHSLRKLVRATRESPPSLSILHGKKDEVVPVQMGYALCEMCSGLGLQCCNLLEQPFAGHNDILNEAITVYARLVFGGPSLSSSKLQ